MFLPKPLLRFIYAPNTRAGLFFLLITAIFLRPVVFNFFDELSGVGDTYEYVWRLWWFKHALIDTGQSPWLVPYIYYPFGYPLAYSELTPANTLFGLPLTLLLGEYSAYNALFFLNFFLTGFTTYLLARYLTGSWWAGLLAGVLFAFTPYRRGQYFHLIHLTIQWFPLIFLFLEKFLQTGRRRYAFSSGVAFGLNALASWYFALAGAVLSLVWLAGKTRPWPAYANKQKFWGGVIIFAVTATALIAPFLPPFLAVSGDPATRAALENTNFWAASPTDYLMPNPFHPLWGRFIEEKILPLTALADEESPTQADFEAGRFFPNSNLNIATEFVMGPGFIAILFALYGLRWTNARRTRPWLFLTAVAVLLSMGLTLHLAGRQVIVPAPPALTASFNQVMNYISLNLSLQPEPFTIGSEEGIVMPLPSLLVRWFVPAVGSTRTWTRFSQFAIFGLVILAAYGAAAWHQREMAPKSRKPENQTSSRSYSLAFNWPWLILITLALFEVWWKPMPTHEPFRQRAVDNWLRQQLGYDALIQYPLESSFNGSQFIYTQAHGKPIVHAYGNPFGFMFGRRHPELLTFPSPASLATLSQWQVRYVLIETAGPGTDTAPALLQKIAAISCLHPATVQGTVHVFELVNCGQGP